MSTFIAEAITPIAIEECIIAIGIIGMAVGTITERSLPLAHLRNTGANPARELVILVTCGMDNERSSVAFTVAVGGITVGLQVAIFVTCEAVDLVRKHAINGVVMQPLKPLAALVKDLVARDGRLWVSLYR